MPSDLSRELREKRAKASREPLDVDISDYGDEWCRGYLAGQHNALSDPVIDSLLDKADAAEGLAEALNLCIGALAVVREMDLTVTQSYDHVDKALRKGRAAYDRFRAQGAE